MMDPKHWKRMNLAIALFGLILAGVGVHRCYAPAAWIFAGAVLVVMGCMNCVREEPHDG